MLPFMVGTAFLTNVFYLPYLGLRSPNSAVPAASLPELSDNDRKAVQVGESKALPVLLVAVFAGLSREDKKTENVLWCRAPCLYIWSPRVLSAWVWTYLSVMSWHARLWCTRPWCTHLRYAVTPACEQRLQISSSHTFPRASCCRCAAQSAHYARHAHCNPSC